MFDATYFVGVQKKVIAYYEGVCVDFSDTPVDLSGRSSFAQDILRACMTIPYGQTRTYQQLAEIAGSPKAARAVGRVMSNNPLPLIIPCHRVIGSDGSMHGFSAPGGIATKTKMLRLER